MIDVRIESPALAARVEIAIAKALADAKAACPPVTATVVRLRTQRRLAELGAARIEGRIAIVRVTKLNARRLPALVEEIRAARPLGVQLVWNGVDPSREHVERHVFAVLERARSTPGGPPVVLSPSETPEEALGILVQRRKERR